MLLDNEEAVSLGGDRLRARGLGGLGEVALLAVLRQGLLGCALPGHQPAVRRLAGAFFAAGFLAVLLRASLGLGSSPARLRFSASIRLMTLPPVGSSISSGSGVCFSLAATSSFTADS